MTEHIYPINEQQIGMKMTNFKNAYGFALKSMSGFTFNDEDWNWNKVIQKYTDKLGKNYGLIEHFKEGQDNSTDFVWLEYEDKEGKFCQEKFERFVDAEKAMVELMEKRMKGKDV